MIRCSILSFSWTATLVMPAAVLVGLIPADFTFWLVWMFYAFVAAATALTYAPR